MLNSSTTAIEDANRSIGNVFMRKRNGIRLVGVARTEGFCPMETTKKSAPHDKQDGEEALSFDPTTPPAQVAELSMRAWNRAASRSGIRALTTAPPRRGPSA